MRNALLFSLLLTICCSSGTPVQIDRPLRFEGYKTFAAPRTYDAPGTIYRVNERGQKLHVIVLDVPVRTGSTELVRSEQRTRWSVAMLARYAGLGSFTGSSAVARDITVKLGTAKAHITDDPSIDQALERAVGDGRLAFKPNNRYYVIREAIAVDSIEYVVDAARVGASGIDVDLAAVAASGSGTANGSFETANARTLRQRFSEPHFVLYNDEQILPPGLGIAGERVRRVKTAPGDTTFSTEVVAE